MVSTAELGSDLQNIGKALGLLDGSGNLDSGWFEHPLHRLEQILTNGPQRTAFFQLLDAVLPPDASAGAPTGETWHPLLHDSALGGVYLTNKATSTGTMLGVAGLTRSSTGTAPPIATLRLHAPLLGARDGSLDAVIGTTQEPIEVDLRLELGWRRPTQAIGLAAIHVVLALMPLASSGPLERLTITLEQFEIDGHPAQDTVLDPDHLGDEAFHVIIGLLQQELHDASGVAVHLLPLLGIGDDHIPAFPIASFASGPAPLRMWLTSLFAAGSADPPIRYWILHLAGLLGMSVPLIPDVNALVPGQGSEASPWRVRLLALDSSSSLDLTVALVTPPGGTTPNALIGVEVTLSSGASAAAAGRARVTLASIPLSGAGSAMVLPSASLLLEAPGDPSHFLVPAPSGGGAAPPIVVRSARGGLSWDGQQLKPLLALDDVTLLGTHYPVVDLTHVNSSSITGALADQVRALLAGWLGGTGTGHSLAALLCLVAPTGETTWPSSYLLDDIPRFVAHPTQVLAEKHRLLLLDSAQPTPAHSWSAMLREIASLLGLSTGVLGTGTPADPWYIPLDTVGFATLELAAWNAQTAHDANAPQQLRLGLRVLAQQAPWSGQWMAELLAVDLPASGTGTVAVVGAQHLAVRLSSVPSASSPAGIGVGADAAALTFDWQPGQPAQGVVTLSNFTLTSADGDMTIAELRFPPAGGFDISRGDFPTSMGITRSDFETLARLLVANAMHAWGGMPGYALSGLLGINGTLPGFPADWPTLTSAAPGTLLSDPLSAFEAWVRQVASGVSTSGVPFLLPALEWFRGLLANALPASAGGSLPSFSVQTVGSGTRDDPWALPISETGGQSVEALVWLEPSGPPPSWTAWLDGQADLVTDFPSLLSVAQRLAPFRPQAREALRESDTTLLAGGLQRLAHYLSESDAVVPLAAQLPSGGTWVHGSSSSPIRAAHHKQPGDANAIAQILAQLTAWKAASATHTGAVLLLGPAFNDHTAWDALLTSVGQSPSDTAATAYFNFRQPPLDPTLLDLSGVIGQVDFYPVDLADDGSGALPPLTAQIARAAARVNTLRPGVPLYLVAHSTAGVAARAYTAANATQVRGLITLGTPHGGASLVPLRDPGVASAIRFVQRLALADLPTGPMRDALTHLAFALDGYTAPTDTKAVLPQRLPYPRNAFAATGSTDTGGVPALALGGTLETGLRDALRSWLASAIAAVLPSGGASGTAPTHLACGVRVALDAPPVSASADMLDGDGTEGDIVVQASVRMDLWRYALHSGGGASTPPPGPVAVRISLTRPGGWLLGKASAYAYPDAASGLAPFNLSAPVDDVRLRWAEMGLDLLPKNGGGLSATPVLLLHDAAYHGPTQALVAFADAAARPLLGALFTRLSTPAPDPSSAVAQLLNALRGLGIVVDDPHGGLGVAADAFAAVATDAVTYLAPRLRTALAQAQIPGLSGPAQGPWTCAVAGMPLILTLTANPWSLGIATSTGDTGGLVLGTLPLNAGQARLQGTVTLALDTFTPHAETTLHLGATALTWSSATGRLTLQAPPVLAPVSLIPAPSAATITAAINAALPQVLLSSIVSALAEAVAGPGFQMAPITNFLSGPGEFLLTATSLGAAHGNGFDAAKVNHLLQIAAQLLHLPSDNGLGLPANLELTATGGDPLVLSLATTAPLGGVLQLALGIGVDRLLHATPQGDMTLTITLPGSWGSVAVRFGIGASGVTLDVTHPAPPSAGAETIHILPTFSGLGALAQGAEALLPTALNALMDALAPGGLTRPSLLASIVDVAAALNLYDGTNRFSGHSANWRMLLDDGWLSNVNASTRTLVVPALSAALSQVGLPVSRVMGQDALRWNSSAAILGGGTLTIDLGWDAQGPTLHVGAQNVAVASGPVTATLAAGYAHAQVVCSLACGVNMQPLLGIDVTPMLTLDVSASHFVCSFEPLGTANRGALYVDLLPAPSVHLDTTPGPTPGSLLVVEKWVVPLTAKLLLSGGQSWLDQPVWTGGPHLRDILQGAHIIDAGNPPTLHSPLPDLTHMAVGVLAQVATGIEVAIAEKLHLAIVKDGTNRLGVQFFGHVEIPADSMVVKVGFGGFGDLTSAKADNGGIELYIFTVPASDTTPVQLSPALVATRIGVELDGADDKPLINTSGFRLGGAGATASFMVDLTRAHPVAFTGAGLDVVGLGLPLGQALSGGASSNPVAASLLRSNADTSGQAGGAQSQNSHPVNPTVDVSVSYQNGTLHVLIQNSDRPIWIPIHAGFGPIYIDQIGFALLSTGSGTAVQLLIDGGVHIATFTAQVEDLSVTIPLNAITTPGNWILDLNGLAVAYSASAVSIAGGLLKSQPPVEYDGMLLGNISAYGLSVIGSYAALSDTASMPAQQFTSLFVFAAIDGPIGGPPFLFITGLGGGIGYNRALVVPTEITDVPNFVLVKAIDDTSMAADPMSALAHFRDALPPQRGSLWLAAGLRFDTFVVVHSVAVVYVELNRGFEVGLLGVSRMQLPNEQFTLVSIELALKARYSSTEGILSIQAQLTSNSWLLNQDCMLTGGFAFFIWFPQNQFVLTLGGYHPRFDKPAQFPTVPRLGFHWAISDVLSIKGESYFALTNSCVMAGGRFEASFDASIVRAWFITYTDFLISWDPFHYDFAIGISIGAEFRLEICVFGCCAGIDISVSLGAQLSIVGPSLHGTATIELEICSVSFEFGSSDPSGKQYIHDWNAFKSKYLIAGGSETDVAAVHVESGLLPIEGSGKPPMGTSVDDAWKLAPEWTFATETRMPATEYSTFVAATASADPNADFDLSVQAAPGTQSIDIAPMGVSIQHSTHRVKLYVRPAGQTSWIDINKHQPDMADWRNHITVTPHVSGVPEGTWLNKDTQTASAANRLALTGVRLQGRAEAINASAQIHIQALVEDLESASLPLPFDPPLVTITVVGLAAEQIAQRWARLSTNPQAVLSGATQVLAGNGGFAQARVAAGRSEAGIPPMAVLAMRGRSAPPLFAPMATGLAQQSAALPPPITIRRPTAPAPIYLEQPRLRTLLQARASAMPTAAAAARTTVTHHPAAQATHRTAPPKASAFVGAALVRAPSETAAPPTTAALGGFTVRTPEIGWQAGAAHVAQLRQAEADVQVGGVTLAAGMSQVWDVTPEHQRNAVFTVRGSSAARITCLGRGGDVLSDREFLATAAGVDLPLTPQTARVAITCLGQVPPGTDRAGDGLGALSAQIASGGRPAATGWQVGSTLVQLGPITFLGRGAVIRTARSYTPRRNGTQTIEALTPSVDAMRDQPGIETRLPLTTSLVMVLLDRRDPNGTGDGDLTVAAHGATLRTPPLRVTTGVRTALLYEVDDRAIGATELSISVASQADWHIAGVLGLPGRAAEWVVRLQGSNPPQFVADGPFTADGSVMVQFRGGQA